MRPDPTIDTEVHFTVHGRNHQALTARALETLNDYVGDDGNATGWTLTMNVHRHGPDDYRATVTATPPVAF